MFELYHPFFGCGMREGNVFEAVNVTTGHHQLFVYVSGTVYDDLNMT